MGEFRKSFGRTFNQMGTHIPHLLDIIRVASCPFHKISKQPPLEALKRGLSMAVDATMRLFLKA
jgi:hypothetical protein